MMQSIAVCTSQYRPKERGA